MFLDINSILVRCGNDEVFADLLDRFWDLPAQAHHLLSYAIIEKGEPWIGAFQKAAFRRNGQLPSVYKLYSHVSTEIDDPTAREWIDHEPAELGWKVLAKRHGNDLIPELIGALPDSFSNLNVIPPLRAIATLDDLPDSVADEIWRRVNGTITPIAIEDIIRALARVRLKGIPSLVGFLRRDIRSLPNLAFNRFLLEYYRWERDTGLRIRVNDVSGERSFGEWIRLARWKVDESDPLVGHYLVNAALPVSDDVLDAWAAVDSSLLKFVRISAPLDRYHSGAVSTLLASPDGITDLIKIFGSILSQFPENALLEVLQRACSTDAFHSLLVAVGASNEASYRRFHSALLARYLELGSIDVAASKALARILSVHSTVVLQELLNECRDTTLGLWLIRDLEDTCRVRLVYETGDWQRLT